MRVWPLFVLAACGRIGFAPSGSEAPDGGGAGDAVPADTIRVVVTGDGAAVPVGSPVAGVAVLFEDAGGALTELHTDAAGLASAEVAGPTTVHVVEDVAGKWQVATLLEVPGGTTLRVGDSTFETGAMTVAAPAYAAANKFEIVGSSGCELLGQGSTSSVDVSYDLACEGETHDLYAIAEMDSSELAWQAIPGIRLAGGTSATATGAWLPTVPRTIQYADLPDGTAILNELFAAAGSDVVSIGDGSGVVAGTTAVTAATIDVPPTLVATTVIPADNTAQLLVYDAFPLPADTFDPSHLPPAITAEVTDTAPQVHVHLGPSALATMIVCAVIEIERPDSTETTWTVCGPTTTTSARYPVAPADIAGAAPPAGSMWIVATAFALGVPGSDYAGLAATLFGPLGAGAILDHPVAGTNISEQRTLL